MKRITTIVSGLLAIQLLFVGAASADEMDFALEWSPTATLGTGSITGTATIDTDILGGLGSFFNEPIANTGFSNIELVVSGTAGGDGTFSSANGDIDSLIWGTAGPIDFTTELVGQPNLLDFNVGFPAPNPNAPTGFGPFVVITSSGETFTLTSFRPVAGVVPEPTSAAVCAIVGSVALLRRRRK